MNTTNNSNKENNTTNTSNLMDNTLNNADENDDNVFDELAFLCSGQFKTGKKMIHHINKVVKQVRQGLHYNYKKNINSSITFI
jgi:hypothetical protein